MFGAKFQASIAV